MATTTTRFATFYAQLCGVLLLLTGLFAVSGLLAGYIGFLSATFFLWDYPLGIAQIVLGVFALYVGFAAKPSTSPITLGKAYGIVLTLLAIVGFASATALSFVGTTLESFENVLHLFLGVLGLAAGFYVLETTPRPLAPTPAPRPAPNQPTGHFAYPPPTERHQPIENIEGVGKTYGAKLRAIGVQEVEDLLARDPDRVAAQADIEPRLVRSWHEMAQLQAVSGIGKQYSELLVRCGVHGLAGLAEERAGPLAKRVEDYEESLEVRVTKGHVSSAMARDWIQQAKAYVREGLPSSAWAMHGGAPTG